MHLLFSFSRRFEGVIIFSRFYRIIYNNTRPRLLEYYKLLYNNGDISLFLNILIVLQFFDPPALWGSLHSTAGYNVYNRHDRITMKTRIIWNKKMFTLARDFIGSFRKIPIFNFYSRVFGIVRVRVTVVFFFFFV